MVPHTATPTSTDTRRLKAAQAARHSVLIVDPDAESVEALSLDLQEAGYEVVSCADAVEFLLQLGRRSYDLVLLEVDLPDIDGCLLVDILAQKWVDSEILLMTSLPPRVMTAHFPRCRPEECLRKPISREELMARVKKALHVADRDVRDLKLRRPSA